MKALITGANRGLGLEFVRQLATRGDIIFATCRAPDAADLLRCLQEEFPDLISITALDVTDKRSIAESHKHISAQSKTLDLLINNAGIDIDDGRLGVFNPETIQEILNVNTIGPLLTTQQYLDMLQKGDQPTIVNISSRWGSIASLETPGPYTYSASKAALNMYTRCLSHDLQELGIIVVALSPGWVITDMGGPNANITPQNSINAMLQFIDALSLEHSGGFYDYTGLQVPW